MITLQNNGDMRPRRNHNKIKINPKPAWQMPTGHREDHSDTTFDNRPKRKRTRQAIDKSWRDEYDM